jgi:hypothetical protein
MFRDIRLPERLLDSQYLLNNDVTWHVLGVKKANEYSITRFI